MIKIAKTVYDAKTIALQDGKEVTLVPLPIGRLKRFMKAWSAFTDIKEEEEAFDIYINCAGISLANHYKEDFPEPYNVETVLADDYREHLEEVLDMDTIFEILEVCGGLKLNDPKLMEAAQAAAIEAAGTTSTSQP